MPMPARPLPICPPADPALWHKLTAVVDLFRRIVGPSCTPIDGSIIGECVSCDCKIWIGPNQQMLMPAPALCLVCGITPAVEGSPFTDFRGRGTIWFDQTFLEGGNP